MPPPPRRWARGRPGRDRRGESECARPPAAKASSWFSSSLARMKESILVLGQFAALIFGGVHFANGLECPPFPALFEIERPGGADWGCRGIDARVHRSGGDPFAKTGDRVVRQSSRKAASAGEGRRSSTPARAGSRRVSREPPRGPRRHLSPGPPWCPAPGHSWEISAWLEWQA